jgi:cyclopropane-fatty-acyl-phospholipid synthase
LQNIQIGRLVLFEGGESKASNVFGANKEGVPVAYLDVRDNKFWVRLALFADMVRTSITNKHCASDKHIG